MRNDAIGLFWEEFSEKDEKKKDYLLENGWVDIRGKWFKPSRDPNAPYKAEKMNLEDAYKLERNEGDKCEPPEPTWLLPTYLPHLEEAQNYNFNLYQYDNDLIADVQAGCMFVMDIECYANYYLIAFKNMQNGKVVYEESFCDSIWNRPKIQWLMDNALVITFNGENYDLPMHYYSLTGVNNAQLKFCSDTIIQQGLRPYKVAKEFNFTIGNCNHIDVKEVAPGGGSLKIYGGRVHTRRMQDLPFPEYTWLSPEQRDIVRWYCINDLDTTADLYWSLEKQIKLRVEMSRKYKVDLRSKSDAQIAETVICTMMKEKTGKWPKKVKLPEDYSFYYKAPDFIQFKTEYFKNIKHTIETTLFQLDEKGKVQLPKEITKLKIKINNTAYQMGIGGLHSKEKKMTHYADENFELSDFDVRSYYPFIIIMQGLFPDALGVDFLPVFKSIVDTRLEAKDLSKSDNQQIAEDNEKIANSLKIVINSCFGKFGSPYSPLFGPNLLIQTTLTGQLALFMLIEQIELLGINVISANTDGIVVKIPKHPDARQAVLDVIKGWEQASGYTMEETPYSSYHAMAVNDYIAVKPNGKFKVKGKMGYAGLSKNPTAEVCTDAATAYILNGTDITQTIKGCAKVSKFVSIRNVTGGGYKDGEFLGKAVRWYYSNETDEPIIYAKNGKKVSKSVGAKPMMLLAEELPNDLDYDWYIEETYKMLELAGVKIKEAA